MEVWKIKRVRRLLDVTQEEMAYLLGTSTCTVLRYERGLTHPDRYSRSWPRLPRIRSAREKLKTFSDEKPSGRLCCGTSWIQFTVVASAPPESQGATVSLGKAW